MVLSDQSLRDDLLKRLRRVEGQLRGVQRMIEEGEPCRDIGAQMSAARKALDSAYVRMTMCFAQQEMAQALVRSQPTAGEGDPGAAMAEIGPILEAMEAMLLRRP
jgi:CsoR family transcriptional regulator, copper-sensing transcriptional repressor